ncbi:TolC family protein [Thermocrinis sp.]|uniref:TolC family protein n=1 Tax=Thermocrinis sp. TaxID=2024383 RepID=UPI002FDEA88B
MNFLVLILFCFNLSLAITLEEAVEIAKKQANRIKLSEIEMRKAEEQIKKAKAGILPQVSFSYTYTYLGQDLALGLTPNNRHVATFQVNQTIFDKSVFELIKLANIQKELQTLLREDVERIIEYQVKDLFYALLYRKQLIGLYEENLEYWQANYKTVEAKFNAGVVPKVELLRATSQLQQAKAQLEQVRGEYLQALEELKALLQLQEISDPKGALELRQLELNEEKLFQYLLENNSTLRALRKALELAQKDVELKKAQYYPTLSGFASYQTFTGKKGVGGNSEWLNGYSFGISLNYRLYDGSLRKAEVALAELELLKQKEDYLQTEYDLKSTLKKALISINSLASQIEAVKASLEAARESLRLSTERYRLGIASQLEVLESRANYNNLLANYYLLLYRHNSAMALLERLVR